MTSTPATFRVTTINAMGNEDRFASRSQLSLAEARVRITEVTRQPVERFDRDLADLSLRGASRQLRVPGNSIHDGARGVVITREESVA